MPVNPLSKTKVAADAKPVVDKALAKVSAQDQSKVKEALAQVAEQNGDKFLNQAEAQQVADCFERAAPSNALLTGAAVDAALAEAGAQSAKQRQAANVDGISTHFSFSESLEAKLIDELNDTVSRAAGRPVEINMMIFEFQSDNIEKAIVDIARAHPHVTFRVVADSTQSSASGGNALPEIVKKKLPNIEVKYKKDFPYVWSASKGQPAYNHGATKGLNHHKGFVSTIDGVPDRLVLGSFNWSTTADTKNYEDLMTFKSMDSSTRAAIEQYQDEFSAYFNNNEATLSPNAFANFKKQQWSEMLVKNGKPPLHFTPLADDSYPTYVPRRDAQGFDLNGFRPADKDRLDQLVGSKVAQAIRSDRARYGRFASFSELQDRVKSVASLPAEKLEALQKNGSFGALTVSVNDASVDELKIAGLPATEAKALVEHRRQNGSFQSVDEVLAKVPGMTAPAFNAVKKYLTATDVEAFFNSRPFGAEQGGTGYGSGGSRTVAAMGADGTVGQVGASVTVAATDLFTRAQAGEKICVAMYGISATSPEFKSMVAAARRGVDVKVVVNDDYTEAAVNAVKDVKSQGVTIDIRVQSAKTMHEKFGVVGDDVFFGSANFSESSSTKHSEDRFAIRNDAETSQAFQARFDALWQKSKVVTS
ncbi:MAG: helix-hairpin-helix domain-containing protein [Deltaproteobacteria bacterium]|nr:helix-hairpin-helix domain-containing protein [Deltaproteobacteria bacterium]